MPDADLSRSQKSGRRSGERGTSDRAQNDGYCYLGRRRLVTELCAHRRMHTSLRARDRSYPTAPSYPLPPELTCACVTYLRDPLVLSTRARLSRSCKETPDYRDWRDSGNYEQPTPPRAKPVAG